MKTLVLILGLFMSAQPAVFAASTCMPGAHSTMSCCKMAGKCCCCCKHHAKGGADNAAGKSGKAAPLPGCSIGCNVQAASFIAPSDKNLSSVLGFMPLPVSTELFGRSLDFAAGILHATSPPLIMSGAFPLPLRI